MLLFDSFGLLGLKDFIMQDDKNKINKILFGLQKLKLTDRKFTLAKTTFSQLNFKRLAEKELGKLSKTARDVFHFIERYTLNDNVHVYILKSQIQQIEADTCGVLQLYFFKYQFKNSFLKIVINSSKTLSNSTK